MHAPLFFSYPTHQNWLLNYTTSFEEENFKSNFFQKKSELGEKKNRFKRSKNWFVTKKTTQPREMQPYAKYTKPHFFFSKKIHMYPHEGSIFLNNPPSQSSPIKPSKTPPPYSISYRHQFFFCLKFTKPAHDCKKFSTSFSDMPSAQTSILQRDQWSGMKRVVVDFIPLSATRRSPNPFVKKNTVEKSNKKSSTVPIIFYHHLPKLKHHQSSI